MASVKTEAEMKAATAQIAKMPQDPRVVKHFEQCWASANAEG